MVTTHAHAEVAAGAGTSGHAYTTQAAGFNVFGESLGSTVILPSIEGALAGSHTVTKRYTSTTGLPWRTVYPASPATAATAAGGALPAETVTVGYSGALYVPAALTGLSGYLTNSTYNAYGQIAQAQIGTTSTNAYLTNTFDPHTSAVTESKLTNTAASPTPLDRITYAYNPAGQRIRQTETRQGTASETQCFGYDGLNRLKQAWTATDSCAADPSTNSGSTVGSGIGGAYWTSWAFDPLGQRTVQTEHGRQGDPDRTTTYTYGANGGGADDSQPHTLTSTRTTSGPSVTGTSSFRYDAAGNTVQRDITTDGRTEQQTLTWDDRGKLSTVTTSDGGTSYIYDAEGSLLLQKEPEKTTLYLPGQQYVLNTETQVLTGTRYYPLPGGQAVRTGSSHSFQLNDPHNTAGMTTNSTFTTVQWRQFTPYGAPRGTDPSSWPDNHGFLGQPKDATTGLTAVGARWYDPPNGRFASLDPLFVPQDTQQLNGYTYAAANPIAKSDPSGLGCTPEGGCGCYGDPKCLASGNEESTGYNPRTCNAACQAYVAALRQARLAAAKRAWLRHQLELRRQERLRAEIAAMAYKSRQGLSQLQISGLAPQNPDTSGYDEPWWAKALNTLIVDDAEKCATQGNVEGCVLFFANFIPGAGSGKVGAKGLKGLEHLLKDEDFLKVANKAAKRCTTDSFTAGTKVLMANGTTKPIEKIKPGDKIRTAPPGTKEQTQTVKAVHKTTTDRTYIDVTVQTKNGPATIKGTSHHLYWNKSTHTWTPATRLRPTETLQTPNGGTTPIRSLTRYTTNTTTYNLTVDTVHTYYVLAGSSPVLVHNDKCPVTGLPHSKLGEAATREALEAMGYTNLVDEVQFLNSRGRPFRADWVAQDPAGNWVAFDAKTGRGSVISENQELGYPELASSGAILDTNKLARFNLRKGSKINMSVELDLWSCPSCNP